MENLSELKRRIIEYLAGLSAFEDITVAPAYPERQRQFPLKSPVITVEVSGAEVSPSGLGGYLGGDTPLYGAAASVTLRFGIYNPAAEECAHMFESLCNALFDAPWPGLQKIGCDRSEYDARTATHFLAASAVLKAAWIVPKQEERLFENIVIKDVRTW